MEDKNQQPLVPDMLYRHTLPQPELPQSEELPLEAAFFEQAAMPEMEIPPEPEQSVPVPPQPEAETVTEELPADTDSQTPPVADMPLPAEEAFPEPVLPAEDPLAEFIPAEEISFFEEPVVPSLEDTIAPVVPAVQEPSQPICDEETLQWLTEEVVEPESSSTEDFYHTFEPEEEPKPVAAPLPDPFAPEFTDMTTEKKREARIAPAKKNTEAPVRKGRPKRKKGYGLLGIPHLLATALWLFIIVAIGSSLGKLLWVGAADVLAFGREDKAVTVTIVDSDTIDTIAAKLQEAGLVKYPELFKIYAKITGDDEEITTGTFELNTILDYHALTNALSPSSSSRTVVKVTIPEGYNCRQIFNLLSSSNVCSVTALEEYAANGELKEYWFLEGVTRGDKYCLEGFLFPDTYEFYVNSTPAEVLTRLLNGFDQRFDEELQGQIVTLNGYLSDLMRGNGKSEDYIASHQFTVRDLVIVASLIEEETAGSAESAKIASVIYNRLYNWGDNPAYLNFDSTIVYAQGGDTSSIDTGIDSPYNTYRNVGLTPTPISNPGLASIKAALEPNSTAYYYFIYNPDTGLHEFSSTYEEHQELIEKLGY